MNNKKFPFKESLKVHINPLLDFLQEQKGKPVHAKDICQILQIRTKRDLRLLVNYIRNNITPRLCSNFSQGYFWKDNANEIEKSLKDKQAFAYDILKTTSKQLKMLKEEKIKNV